MSSKPKYKRGGGGLGKASGDSGATIGYFSLFFTYISTYYFTELIENII